MFNKSILPGCIPPNVTHLTFGYYFNKPIILDSIPQSTTHLIFGYKFNQSIKPGYIPTNVEYLEFGDKFNKNLSYGCIPENIKYIKFGCCFNKSIIPNCVPKNIEYLISNNDLENFYSMDCVFPGIKRVMGFVVKNMENVSFMNSYIARNYRNNRLSFCLKWNKNKPVYIPNADDYRENYRLILGDKFNQNIEPGDIPSQVTQIIFGENYDRPIIPGCISSNVTHLFFGKYFNSDTALNPWVYSVECNTLIFW